MALANDCPTSDVLQLLLLGRGDDTTVATWERHITDCPRCAERAASLPSGDDFVDSVRRAAPDAHTPEPEVVATLVQAFRQMGSIASGRTASWAPKPRASTDGATYLAEAKQPNEIGRLGPYSILETLGTGGMGVVYRGFDSRLQRTVAIKMIRPEQLANPGMTERFVAEARAAAKVECDHIVTVHAVEEHGGVPCITMPLLQGETLDKLLRRQKGPMPVADILKLARGIAIGLAAAHDARMIHRDIKPGNLWIERPGGRVKILDFGLALPAASTDDGSRFAGTPGYMAPEQASGKGVDARADLFSLGCVLYQAASGSQPFDAETPIGRIIRTVTCPAKSVAESNADLPAGLVRLIDGLLAKTPGERPESAAAVLLELDRVEAEFELRRKRKNRRRLLGAVAASLLLGSVGAWGAFQAFASKPELPVSIAFELDPDVGPLVLARDGNEWPLDPNANVMLDLAPGDYTVRTAKSVPGREPVPNSFIVLPKEPKTVRIALVGEIAKSSAHAAAVTGVAAFAVDGRLGILSASLDRTLGLWRPESTASPRVGPLESPATVLAASRDGSLVATAGGNKVAPFDLAIHLFDGRTLAKRGLPLTGHTRRCSALGVSPDGRWLLSAAPGELWLWDVAKRTRRELPTETPRVTAIAFDPHRPQALTGGDDGFATLWDLVEAKPIRRFIAQAVGSNGGLGSIAFTPNGFVTSGDDGTIRLWDRETFQAKELPAASKAIRALAASSDGKRILTGGDDGIVRLRSLPDGAILREYVGHTLPLRGLAFTPDGRGAVSGSEDRTVRHWRLPR